jgi:hypothetical protein
MTTKVQPRKPGGFGELLPGQQIEFNRLLDIIKTTYEKYGFSPIDTPDLELTEVLLAKGGGETEQQVYSFKREGSNTDLTLRYDLTIPLARFVAEHESDLVFPLDAITLGRSTVLSANKKDDIENSINATSTQLAQIARQLMLNFQRLLMTYLTNSDLVNSLYALTTGYFSTVSLQHLVSTK